MFHSFPEPNVVPMFSSCLRGFMGHEQGKASWGGGKQGPPQRALLKSFLRSSTKKTIPETCPVSIPGLTLFNCRSLLPAKEVALKTAKLRLSRSSERRGAAWLLCSPSPAGTVPFLPVSNTSTEGELQVPLSLLPCPWISQHLSPQGWASGNQSELHQMRLNPW